MSCKIFDEGFGSIPGAESHGTYCFCSIWFLFITGRLYILDKIQTGKWLDERQTFLEGFNGRSGKLFDVSYFWSVLNNIFMIGREDFFDKDLLIKLIFEHQDNE